MKAMSSFALRAVLMSLVGGWLSLSAAGAVAEQIAPVRTTISGTEYVVTHETIGGVQQVIYTDPGGRRFTQEALSLLYARTDKRSEDLVERLRTAGAGDMIPVIVQLSEQPLEDIVAAARRRYGDGLEALEAELRQLNSVGPRPPRPLNADGERDWAERYAGQVNPKVLQARAELVRRIDRVRTQMQHEIGAALTREVEPQQTAVTRLIESLGGHVTNRLRIINAVAGRIPAAMIEALAASNDVVQIFPNTQVVGHLDDSTCAIGTNSVWSYGVTGAGFQAAVLDTGVKKDHPFLAPAQLQTHVSLDFISTQPGFADVLSDVDLLGHGTHVTGIVVSQLPTFLGVAHGAFETIHVKSLANVFPLPSGGAGLGYASDHIAGAEWAVLDAANPAEAINGSFGAPTTPVTSNITFQVSQFDWLIDKFGVGAAFAAGNDGQAAMSVNEPCIAFNAICVANFNDNNTCAIGNDFIASSSSAGPAPDGRRKPEISAPGTNITSMSLNNSLATFSGTSMAAPHVAGALLLLSNLGILDPRAQRALLVNTSRPVPNPLGGGSAWNGYGALELSGAWFHRNDVYTSTIFDADIPQLTTRLYKGPMMTGERATLAVNRHFRKVNLPTGGYNLIPVVNSLTLSIYRESDNTQLSAAQPTTVDPLAVVQMNEPGTVDTIVKVKSFGQFAHGPDTDIYGLATQEFFEEANLFLAIRFLADFVGGGFADSGSFPVRVVISNNGSARAHNVDFRLDWDLPAGWSVVADNRGQRESGDESVRVGALDPREARTYRYLVCSPVGERGRPGPGPDEEVTIAAKGEVTSRSYGESFSNTGELLRRFRMK